MVSETSEKALEDLIEAAFLSADYVQGSNKDFDADLALDTKQFWAFLEATQSDELDKLRPYADWQARVLNRLNNKIKKDGILTVLKKGLSVESAHLKLLYRLPYNTLNPEVERLFDANIFSVTRQVHFSNSTPMDSVDMVLFINGLPIVTMELKQPWKGQNVHHARKQYQDRNHREPLFEFGRCLVHFAVDTHDVSMATKLAGKSTFFLPFNKGDGHGKGNPINPTGHKTAYLWEEVLEKRSLTNIIEHFAKMVEEVNKETGKKTKTLFFPRYHQLDVVRQVLNDVKSNGVGQRYLIQHSAGSGKSNSITWLGYQLIETYNAVGTANIFDSVIVVTDRRVLDKQLKDNIRAFSEVKNVVAHAYNSAELKSALENGKKLIITTIQKFPWILDGISDLSDRKFAVIIDEAHSSQSGSAADKMNEAISGGGDEEEPEDLQDKILAAMARRKMGNNASFFAFTATPKNTTLERFGRQNAEGKFVPFHLYSMKQAIEEQFILDVLKNYTTYKSYYELQKSIEDNPEFNTKKAQGKLRAYVEAHPDTIKTKAAIMLDHFRDNVVRPKKLKGKARAMVVTRNIESAIRYFLAIRETLNAAGSPYKAVVAFTGKKMVDGVEHTEDSLNGFPGNDIAKKFKDDEYRILVVANKFLTGFDEPMLTTMYVDKKLQGVLAVQTLSRLNRANKKLGKEETFILDFHNTVEDIKDAFDPFYTSTALSQPTDVNVLHDLKDHLDDTGIYEWDEVVQFNELFFDGVEADQLSPILDTAAGRFDELDDDDKIGIKIKAKQFVKIYAQVACIIPFENAEWEMLHWFLKFLIPEMKVKDKDQDEIDGLLDSVDLTTYGLERVKIGHTIGLDDSDSEIDPPNANPRGGHDDPETDPLDMIIAAFNERYFNGWDATPEEQRIKLINILNHAMSDPAFQDKVVANPDQQNRRIASEALFEKAMRNERRREIDLYKKYASDDDFKSGLHEALMRMMEQMLKSNSRPGAM
ncbi:MULTISPECIES: DEAD/DEAH box helicase family protein [unclassified Ruegeria]|uniref:type I restriction endonuclease subunit R n=1 Tax=unclassified Ruegeria TaxID=2625375 RepID=UPI001ADA5114|nr:MULTISPECIES: DEAD/DEAH box helicase family protein [unclassified Ruegeria]MBO9413773.1 type I restriction endonuclease subunit R [Ruegeria sp. R8_1]MBO9417757.1 type I restriction endonuclease subunit R [Ruegeria sp. R8_2]